MEHHGPQPQNQRNHLRYGTVHTHPKLKHHSNSRGHTEAWESLMPTRGATPKRGNPYPQLKGPLNMRIVWCGWVGGAKTGTGGERSKKFARHALTLPRGLGAKGASVYLAVPCVSQGGGITIRVKSVCVGGRGTIPGPYKDFLHHCCAHHPPRSLHLVQFTGSLRGLGVMVVVAATIPGSCASHCGDLLGPPHWPRACTLGWWLPTPCCIVG